jgi:hypothetical protein
MVPLSPSVAIRRNVLFTRMPIFASSVLQTICAVIWGEKVPVSGSAFYPGPIIAREFPLWNPASGVLTVPGCQII